MTALLIITLVFVGSASVVKHREMPLEQCRQVAPMLTERGKIYARCIILPPRESFGHKSMEPRKGRLA